MGTSNCFSGQSKTPKTHHSLMPSHLNLKTGKDTNLHCGQIRLYVLDSKSAETMHLGRLEVHRCVCKGMFHIRNWHGVSDWCPGKPHRIFLLVVVQDQSHLVAQLLLSQDSHIRQTCCSLTSIFACGGN